MSAAERVSAATWRPVNATVDAKVGSALIRLMPYTPHPDPDEDAAPWAVVGMCRVTFRFNGQLVTTKKLRASWRWRDHLGWASSKRPSASSIAGAVDAVSEALREQVRRHGIDPSGVQVIATVEVDDDLAEWRCYEDWELDERKDDVECTFCGGDGVAECNDPIQCFDPDCTGSFCRCTACDGRGVNQVVW